MHLLAFSQACRQGADKSVGRDVEEEWSWASRPWTRCPILLVGSNSSQHVHPDAYLQRHLRRPPHPARGQEHYVELELLHDTDASSAEAHSLTGIPLASMSSHTSSLNLPPRLLRCLQNPGRSVIFWAPFIAEKSRAINPLIVALPEHHTIAMVERSQDSDSNEGPAGGYFHDRISRTVGKRRGSWKQLRYF